MSSETDVGRNDRCPCGSGRKYKNCCRRKAGRMGTVSWIGLLAMVAAAAFLAVYLLGIAGGRSEPAAPDTSCPPGQTWSSEHGHCHDM